MDEFAIQVFEHHLAEFVSTLAEPRPQLFLHDHLEDGNPEKVDGPRIIVSSMDLLSDIAYPQGPATDIVHVDLTGIAVYIETPLIVPGPEGGPDEVDGEKAVHIPICEGLRSWLKDNRLGLSVPAEIQAAGCECTEFGMWQPQRREQLKRRVRDRYWRSVFFVVLQKLEVS